MPKVSYLAAVLVTGALLTGCSTTVISAHGQVIRPQQMALLEPGHQSKMDVQRILGTPSSVSAFDDQQWLYISSKTVSKPLRPNQLQERRVLVVNFDKDGKLINFTEKSLNDGRDIAPDSRETPTQGQSPGILDQMLQNLGRTYQ